MESLSTKKIGYLQNDPRFGDIEFNLHQVEQILPKDPCDLLVLPELFASGYTFTSKEECRNFAEPISGDTISSCINWAQKIDGAIVAGFPEFDDSGVFNSACLVDAKGIQTIYQKTHLFNREKDWFLPGKSGFRVHEINGMHIGIMICFDWIFPEAARTLTLLGSDIIAHPANLVLPYCQNAMITRCLENKIYSVTANRIGSENRGDQHYKFTGGSQITGPAGKPLSKASESEIQVDIVSIEINDVRSKWLNFRNNLIDDRRPQLYFPNSK